MTVSAYQQAQKEGQSVVRAAVLDAAKRLLVSEGPAALTVRRISGEVGCSTKVIYTLFGGKDGLGEALWLEGFARFERWLLAVPPSDDPFERLHAGLMAYREYALSEPDYYRVMFQGALPGLKPGPEAVEAAKRTFELLLRDVVDCLDAGLLRGAEAREIADVLWMAVHGAVGLEISGFFDRDVAGRRYRLLCVSVLTPFLAAEPPADEFPASEFLASDDGRDRS
ncbi:Transcriptional regulator, TetR family [[Actinomadura] parvosata subsp. kistnae]|uniref:TetR family transcriptional regulator n=1 Tax=[Actinomadura] parvosata subsp. kistnae TaxID=1909395 RepID=A0A1V0A399_9ACTN|nr:WHG domain-containing protein [Nonomuraea sp. ATCC 55076]AQZ64695.1 TetR family transcriptional regulator [Nonomuraea sp. ATCC 55076]SPL98568.1 Transcriptional regulator, TetR family [Actinomadura parvosata subsp. kistnae]